MWDLFLGNPDPIEIAQRVYEIMERGAIGEWAKRVDLAKFIFKHEEVERVFFKACQTLERLLIIAGGEATWPMAVTRRNFGVAEYTPTILLALLVEELGIDVDFRELILFVEPSLSEVRKDKITPLLATIESNRVLEALAKLDKDLKASIHTVRDEETFKVLEREVINETLVFKGLVLLFIAQVLIRFGEILRERAKTSN